jgi:hypothetical protein
MEPEGPLPYSQEPATCPYSEHFNKHNSCNLVVTLGAPVQIWQWVGCGRQQPNHVEVDHNANVCPVRLSHPAACSMPDLHKGPRTSLKTAPVMFTKTPGNLSSLQHNPKSCFHALNTYVKWYGTIYHRKYHHNHNHHHSRHNCRYHHHHGCCC